MKTKEELNELKNEVAALNKKLNGLTEDELKVVTGGSHCGIEATPGSMIHVPPFGEVIEFVPYGDTGLSPDVNKKEFLDA